MRIAVVVPAREAAHLLADCLAAIRSQSVPPDEIWIVVGPSHDGTHDVATRLADDRTRVVANPAGDRASALNAAIAASLADAFAFVDAQSRLAPDYLETAIRLLHETNADVVGGPMRPQGRSPVGRAMAVALQSPFGVGDSQFHFDRVGRFVDSVYLGVYRAAVFERVGLYNESLLRTEDDDLNQRLRDAGMRMWLDPRIRSTYLCREALSEIWAQYHGYGYWKVALATVQRRAIRLRHLAPSAFTLAVTGSIFLSARRLTAAFPLFAAFYSLAAWMAVGRGAHLGIAARAAIPLVTAAMHLGYGVGFLRGLAHWTRLSRVALAGANGDRELLPSAHARRGH